MELSEALDILQEAFLIIIKTGGPILVIALVVGLLVSIIQAATQIQEQTLSFVPKLISIILALILFGSFMMNTLTQFTEKIFELIAGI